MLIWDMYNCMGKSRYMIWYMRVFIVFSKYQWGTCTELPKKNMSRFLLLAVLWIAETVGLLPQPSPATHCSGTRSCSSNDLCNGPSLKILASWSSTRKGHGKRMQASHFKLSILLWRSPLFPTSPEFSTHKQCAGWPWRASGHVARLAASLQF